MRTSSILVAGLLLLAACGGPPGNNPMLEEARMAYDHVKDDPAVVAHAPVALKAAKENLEKGEALHREKEDKDLVTHYAYLARQRVRIAEKKAELGSAEKEIAQAELERKEVLIEAREAEAAKAKENAAQAERQAKAAQQQAEQATDLANRKMREAAAAEEAARQALMKAEELARRVAELEAQQTERGLVLTLSDVLFDVDKATLKPGAERAITELTAFLNEYPKRNVRIEGFTDATGGDEYNRALSERRADAVRAALVANGISPERVTIHGYGKAFPVATNDTAAGRQRNRRVEVIISDETGVIPGRVATR